MTSFFLWIILFIICWPVAIFAVIIYPFVWLLLLPFKILGITVNVVFDTLIAIIKLPLRVLKGYASAG